MTPRASDDAEPTLIPVGPALVAVPRLSASGSPASGGLPQIRCLRLHLDRGRRGHRHLCGRHGRGDRPLRPRREIGRRCRRRRGGGARGRVAHRPVAIAGDPRSRGRHALRVAGEAPHGQHRQVPSAHRRRRQSTSYDAAADTAQLSSSPAATAPRSAAIPTRSGRVRPGPTAIATNFLKSPSCATRRSRRTIPPLMPPRTLLAYVARVRWPAFIALVRRHQLGSSRQQPHRHREVRPEPEARALLHRLHQPLTRDHSALNSSTQRGAPM